MSSYRWRAPSIPQQNTLKKYTILENWATRVGLLEADEIFHSRKPSYWAPTGILPWKA